MISDLSKLSANEVPYYLTDIISCRSGPKDGILVNLQLRVAETNNTNNTLDLQRFGISPSMMPNTSYCQTKQTADEKDRDFYEVQVNMNDTRILGLSLVSRGGATYNFGTSNPVLGVNRTVTIPVTRSLVGFQVS